jgi:signal transduction histidine kinase
MAKDTQGEQPSNEPSVADRRGGYLGFVAHEVRNPLSTALWSAELLARMAAEERGGPRGEKLTAMCLRSLTRVRQLVEDHFMAERLDAGGIPIRAEAVALGALVGEVIERKAADVGEVSASIDATFVVSVDRALAERTLDALVAAAGRDATPVTIRGRSVERGFSLDIEGAAATREQLDDPRKGTPGDPKGRALALPLARRLAEAMGGSLVVEDGGFVLTLPRAPAYTARPPDPAARP